MLHYRFPFARLCFTLGFQPVKRAEALPPRSLHSREGKGYRGYTSTRNFHWEICIRMHARTHIGNTNANCVVYIHVVGSWAIRRGKRKWGGSGWIVSNPWDRILGLQSSRLGIFRRYRRYNIMQSRKYLIHPRAFHSAYSKIFINIETCHLSLETSHKTLYRTFQSWRFQRGETRCWRFQCSKVVMTLFIC